MIIRPLIVTREIVPPTYYVTTSGTNGTVVANPSSGITGTEVTLSNTPDSGYEFDSYTITGATLKNTNQFDIGNTDVNVIGNFIQSRPPVPEDGVLIGDVIWSKFYVDYSISGVNPRKTYTYHNKSIAFYAYNDLRNVTFPNNWRLPTSSDYNNLYQTVGRNGGNKLISVEDGGTDDYGMNLYKTGYLSGSYYSTKNNTGTAYFMYYSSTYLVYATTDTLSNIGESYVSTSYKAIPIRLVLNV